MTTTGNNHNIGNSEIKPESLLVFISHITEEKALAHDIKHQIEKYGFKGFVAHDDIEPQRHWAKEIQNALKQAGALVSIASGSGGRSTATSAWCNQEIGWAYGRGIPVIALKANDNPPGLLSAVQAYQINPAERHRIGFHIAKEIAITKGISGERATSVLCDTLKKSSSYDDSRGYFELIEAAFQAKGSLLPDQCLLLRQALENGQVFYADYGELKPRIEHLLSVIEFPWGNMRRYEEDAR